MEKINSISELTYNLKNIARDIRKAIAKKGILDEDNIKDDLSLFSRYIIDTIIANFEDTLKTTFSYPQTIVDYIYKRFSLGGYYFYKVYQEPNLTRDDGTEMTLEEYPIPADNQKIRDIFKSSKITYEGIEYDIAYFPILNLTEFDNINDLFTGNRIVIGLPKVIYDSSKVTSLSNMFDGCRSLHHVSLIAEGGTSKVPMYKTFNNCIILEDFTLKNIIPTNITLILDNNDITAKAIEGLNLTQIKSVGSLGYIFSHTGDGDDHVLNLYMPRCMSAIKMLDFSRAGCGNITLGVGCKVDFQTFGWGERMEQAGIISGVVTSINLSNFLVYNAQSVHNWLYSVATDVRTYGHPDDSNPDKVRKLTFCAISKTSYEGSDLYIEDLEKTVYIQDTLTDENTLDFPVGDNELESLKDAISSSTSLKKPLELYDAIYNRSNNTRYYITSLEGETVADFHKCTFTIFEDGGKEIARLAEGTIFDLMEQRKWTYGE